MFKNFNDMTSEDVNFDFQMHTNRTDGTSEPEEMVEKAISLNLKAMAFTEHVRESTDWFDEFKEKIDSLKNDKIKILLGIETKAKDFKGTLDATQDIISKTEIVLGVVHRYPDGKGGLLSLDEIKALDKEPAAKTEFELAMGLLDNKDVDVLGHPFGVYAKFHGEIPKALMEKIIIKAKEKGIAIEINTKYELDQGFLDLLRELNPLVSIGSDAHSPEEIGRSFDKLREALG